MVGVVTTLCAAKILVPFFGVSWSWCHGDLELILEIWWFFWGDFVLEQQEIRIRLVVLTIFYFHPYLGMIPYLTNIFQMGWNHQLGIYGRWGYELSMIGYRKTHVLQNMYLHMFIYINNMYVHIFIDVPCIDYTLLSASPSKSEQWSTVILWGIHPIHVI